MRYGYGGISVICLEITGANFLVSDVLLVTEGHCWPTYYIKILNMVYNDEVSPFTP